jgi:methionine-S-sulfoxide reductase
MAPDAEALQVVFDPEKVTYRTLLEYFYKMHDPTTANRQGPDVGSQYRSGIFYHDAEQEKIAKDVTAKVNKQWWKGAVATEVLPAGQWWDAESYHQLYLKNSKCILFRSFGMVANSTQIRLDMNVRRISCVAFLRLRIRLLTVG